MSVMVYDLNYKTTFMILTSKKLIIQAKQMICLI